MEEKKYFTYGKDGRVYYYDSLNITKLVALWFCFKYGKSNSVDKFIHKIGGAYITVNHYGKFFLFYCMMLVCIVITIIIGFIS